MKSVFSKSYLLAAVAMLGLSAAAQATASLTAISDTGTWRVTTYNASNVITGTGTSPLTNPYGAPPLPLTVTTPTGKADVGPFNVVFTPTADFLAYASNSGGPNGKSVQMDGKIDFYITLSAPAKLTANVYEDGVYSLTGNGTFGVSGGVVFSAVDPVTNVALETKNNSFAPETRNGSGGWTLSDTLIGGLASPFSTTYTKYKISIDNTLLAESLSGAAAGSAYVAKKDFTVIFTTDFSSGTGVPEPASLGVLALGGLALLARRRRA